MAAASYIRWGEKGCDEMEFTGCVYPRPGDTDIRVDADGREYPFSLTKAQVAEMDFVGLPIRLEHAERSTVGAVGRVVDVAQDPTTRRTAVKFRLDDTPAGNAAAAFIERDHTRDLSLQHLYHHEDASVTPVEISLCVKGARPGSHIYKGREFEDLNSPDTNP